MDIPEKVPQPAIPRGDDPVMVCAVCARVLDLHTHVTRSPLGIVIEERRWYVHTQQDITDGYGDHEPVAVPETEVRATGSCDFCYAQNPTHVLPAADFSYEPRLHDRDTGERIPLPEGVPDVHNFVGAWSACGWCADLIEQNRWAMLLDRVMARYDATGDADVADPRRRRAVATGLEAVWDALRRNITGPIRPAAPR